MRPTAMAIVAALLLSAPPAMAQWVTYRETTPDTKAENCNMSTSSGGKGVVLWKFANDSRFYVHLLVSDFVSPRSGPYSILATFDSGRAWRLSAEGAARGAGGLLATMPAGDFLAFLTDIRIGKQVRFDLSPIERGEWTISLAGSSAAADEFSRCLPQVN